MGGRVAGSEDPAARQRAGLRHAEKADVLIAGIDDVKHGDRAVVLGAGDPPGALFAADQPSLPIHRMAVGVAGRLAEPADRAGCFAKRSRCAARCVQPSPLQRRKRSSSTSNDVLMASGIGIASQNMIRQDSNMTIFGMATR
jgi:hypothetical protein